MLWYVVAGRQSLKTTCCYGARTHTLLNTRVIALTDKCFAGCRGVGARALSNGINSAVFFCFFEALRASFAQKKKEQVKHAACLLDTCLVGIK